MKTNLAGTSSQRVPPNSVDDDGGEEGWGAEEGVAQRQAAIIQRKKIESETLLMSKRLFYLLCCYVFVCTIMLWYDTIGLYAGLGFAPISLETFDFNSTNSSSASTSATPSSLPPQLSPSSEEEDLELPPRSVDPPIDPPELAEANADEAEPPEPEPADIEPSQNSKSDEAEPSEDEGESSERPIETVPTEQQQSRNSSYPRPLVLDAHRMKQSSNDHLPTPMDLEGFTQWGACRFASECSPPYLHLIVPHQGRSSCFARLVRAFGPHTHKPEDVACTCLMVADVVRPPQSPKQRSKKMSSRPPKLEEKEKEEKKKEKEKEEERAVDVIMDTILTWPGPHVLLRWRGPFGKLVAMDQLLHSITAPSNQSIVFVLDVDMVVKQGVIQDLRSLPKLGQAFYAPIVFKLKAPPYPIPEEYVEAEPSGSEAVKATDGYGAYRTSGWGMLAFYKEDFDKLGGFGAVERSMFNIKKSIWNWGMEDTLHASILRQSGLEQIRRRANNLIHFYHER